MIGRIGIVREDWTMVLSETSHFESIYGQPLTMSSIQHDKCIEYILEKPLVPVYKLCSFHFAWLCLSLASFSILLEKHILTVFSVLLVLHFSLKIPWEVRKETLLIVPRVGLQISTVYRSGCERTAYISRHSVKDVLINEAITGQKVLFYLALLINQSDNIKGKLIPLFQNTMPRLNCLEKVYRGIHEMLSKG